MHNKTKTNTEPPQPMGSTPNNGSTTEQQPLDGQQPRPKGGINAFYWYQIFALDSVERSILETALVIKPLGTACVCFCTHCRKGTHTMGATIIIEPRHLISNNVVF